MCIIIYLCVSFMRWVYLYIEGCLVINTLSETDLIRRMFACVCLRVINNLYPGITVLRNITP